MFSGARGADDDCNRTGSPGVGDGVTPSRADDREAAAIPPTRHDVIDENDFVLENRWIRDCGSGGGGKANDSGSDTGVGRRYAQPELVHCQRLNRSTQ
jgi:hypothetical protein